MTLQRRDRLVVLAAAVVGHLVVGYWLYRAPMFAKYPDIVAGLRSGHSASLPSDASPLYLALNFVASPWVIRLLQAIVGVAAALSVAETGARLSSRGAGLIAGLVAAFAQPLLLYEATLEPDALLAGLSAIAICLAVLDRPVGSGVAAGLMTALRPTAGVPVLVIAVWLWQRRSRRSALVMAAAALVAAGIPAGIVRAKFGGSTAGTMSFGQVLHQANMPEGVGDTFYEPLAKPIERQMDRMHVAGGNLAHEVYRQLASASEGRQLDARESELFWARRALAFPRLHPLAWLRLEALKAHMMMGPTESHDIVAVAMAAERTKFPLVPAWLLYPLGCLGLCFWALRPGTRLPALCAVAAALPYLIFSVTPRYRLVLAPLACLGVGAVVMAILELVKQRERKELLRFAGALLVALWLVVPTGPLRALARASERGMEATALSDKGSANRRFGNLPLAASLLADAVGKQPLGFEMFDLRSLSWEKPSFWDMVRLRFRRNLSVAPSPALEHDAGIIDELAGDRESALAHYRRAADGGYYLRSANPEYRLGRLLLEMGRLDEARRALDVALDHHPGVLATLAAAEVLARHAGDAQRADALHRETDALHDRISAGWERARAWRWIGDPRAALTEITAIPTPENALVRWEECLARLATGDEDGALAAYGRAIALLPMHPYPAARLDEVIARHLERAPTDAVLLRLGGEHSLRRGALKEAVERFNAALTANPALKGDQELMSHLAVAERMQPREQSPF